MFIAFVVAAVLLSPVECIFNKVKPTGKSKTAIYHSRSWKLSAIFSDGESTVVDHNSFFTESYDKNRVFATSKFSRKWNYFSRFSYYSRLTL